MVKIFGALVILVACSAPTSQISEENPSTIKVRVGLAKDGEREVALSHPTAQTASFCLLENQQCSAQVFTLNRETTTSGPSIFRSLEIPADLMGEFQFTAGDEKRSIVFENPQITPIPQTDVVLKDSYNIALRQGPRETKLVDELKGQRYAILDFAASWCGPCRAFISQTYPNHKDALAASSTCKFLSIVDAKDEDSWKNTVGPELASHAFSTSNLTSAMNKQFGIEGSLPTILLLDLRSGEIVTKSIGAGRDEFAAIVQQCTGG